MMCLHSEPRFRGLSRWSVMLLPLLAGLAVAAGSGRGAAQENPPAGASPPAPQQQTDPPETAETAPEENKLRRLSPNEAVWVDTQRKLVVVDAEVVLREGLLEMFACPKGTKEHESVLAIEGKASTVHAGLLAIGAKPGSPVQFNPEYRAASGEPLEILVLWVDNEGKRHTDDARTWVREFKTRAPLKERWVFAGSSFWKNPADNKQYYQGDSGDFICVSNFPTATLDLPINSTQSNDNLMYEAFTENIPPLGAKVRLVLKRLEESKKADPPASEGDKDKDSVPTPKSGGQR